MGEQTELKVFMYSRTGRLEIPSTDIINFHSNASVKSYCDTFQLTLKQQKGELGSLIEPKKEIEIWAGKKEEFHKLIAGYIDKIVTEKKENLDEITQIFGRSYDAVLVDTKISGKIDFEQGYSQAIRMLLKNTPFSEGEVENSTGKGTLIFRGIAIMEIIKYIVEVSGWIFRLDYDKKYHFIRALPQKSVHTLENKDIKSYRIVKQ